MLRPTLPLLGASLLAVPACISIEDAPHTETDEQALIGDPCGEPFCGNTPKLGDFPVFELDMTMAEASTVGNLKIVSFVDQYGNELWPVVDGFELYGIRVSDHKKIAGADIDNSRMRIKTGPENPHEFELTINIAPNVPYYENGDDGIGVPTYLIRWEPTQGGGVPRALCPGPGDRLYESLLYTGDRYDAFTGDVTATGAAAHPWFNVACKDDARWKLALMRYVEAAQDDTHRSTAEEREAGLRSIRADYCGNGIAMTQLGTDIDWDSTGGWLTVDAKYEPVEAIWTDAGAECISHPRFVALKDIRCHRPKCSVLGWNLNYWQSQGDWITYLP